MTNVSGSRGKVDLRNRLRQIGIEALEADGWQVERIPKSGKSSVRRITRGNESRRVAIRTTQDTYISFPRNADDTEWVTLSEVDSVVAVSVDDAASPKFGLVHMIDADDMRERFDRAYAARRAADHSIPVGRGVWVPLYVPDAASPPSHVGGGAGIDNPPIARVSLTARPRTGTAAEGTPRTSAGGSGGNGGVGGTKAPAGTSGDDTGPLTFAQAKRGLGLYYDVDPSKIRITVEA